MRSILTILIFTSMFHFLYAQNAGINKEDSLSKILPKNSDKELDPFIKILIEQNNAGQPWIARKEIAAWSATVLFLTIIFILFSNKEKLKIKKVYVILFCLILLWLFSLFVHQQFGAIANGMALQGVYNYLVYKSDINLNVPFEGGWDLPDTVNSLVKKQQKNIRAYSILTKPTLPILHFIYKIIGSKKKITTIEMEESIQYDIMIIITIAFLLFIIRGEKNMKHNSSRHFLKNKYKKPN